MAVVLAGCGGKSSPTTSTVTGAVVDVNFNPITGATVRANGQSTTTSETGSYQLTGLKAGQVEIIATLQKGSTLYRGRTWVYNTEDEQQRSANIVMAPESELATVQGTVKDRDGYTLQGAAVFAYFGTSSSQKVFTDDNGHYILRDLVANVNYTLSASGQTYRSDQTNVTLSNGQTRTINFTLDNPGLPTLTPPQNVGITSWVSYPGDSRGREGSPLAWAKSRFDKDRNTAFKARTRSIRTDMIVEAELYWDQQQFPDLYGFGVYRANGLNGSLQALDFYFDPLAPYYQDVGLNPDSAYSYALTTISTLYPQYSQTESALSSRVGVYTLDLLQTKAYNRTSKLFSWYSGTGATDYIVYLFDQYPDVGVSTLWSNESSPTTGTSLTYTGPTLQAGKTYYYFVMGGYDNFSARTISKVQSFIP